MRVMTVVGTRPEIIRLSRIIAMFDEAFDHVLVHTGQNYDPRLNDVFFDELKIRAPDRYLGVDTSSLGAVLGGVLVGVEESISEFEPDACLVLGDTNSAIAAVMAKRMGVPVYHMEAGNRCFDENVPEETNRRLVDHVADFNLVYTEHARRNLIAEGLHPRRIMLTGSPMREVLEHYRPGVEASDVLDRLEVESGRFFLVSAHREENVDDPRRLRRLLSALGQLHETYGLPVLVSTHPRTRSRLSQLKGGDGQVGVHFHHPLGLFDYCKLQLTAACVLSDSGTVSEESLILGFPAVTLRDSIERPEALDTGGIVTCGVEETGVLPAVALVMAQWDDGLRPEVPVEYEVRNTSQRVANFVQSTANMHASWAALRRRRPATSDGGGQPPTSADGG